MVKGWNWSKYASRRAKPGEAPGTIHVDPEAPKPELRFMGFGPDDVVEGIGLSGLEPIREHIGKHSVLWVDVYGLGSASLLKELGELFEIHPLALEDIVHIPQRPKVDAYEDSLYIVLRMALGGLPLDTEQFSLFFGPGLLITFQERKGDVLDPVRKRVRDGKPKLRHGGADYLAYAILDTIVDAFFPLLEQYGDHLGNLEDEILADPRPEAVPRLHEIKREFLRLRRFVWPTREMLGMLYRDEFAQITESTRPYLRDCYDHAIQLMEIVESYREVASGLMDLYLSSISNRMNEVMKVLTIIATLFIPLSFIVGLYGMNFDTSSPMNMPELAWRYGYLAVLGAMALVVVSLLLFFWRKGWIGRR